MRKRLVCWLLAAALLAALCPAVGADNSIIFLALNDTMPYPLDAGTMPYWSGGSLYVHSSTFNITSLNLSASYNAGNMTLLLYSGLGRRSLTFYLADGYVQTQDGDTAEVVAAMRGDQIFVPLDYCAAFFGIGVSYLTSASGWPVVRLTTGAQVWEDALFVEKAEKLISDRADKYQGVSAPEPVQPPEPPKEDTPVVQQPPEEVDTQPIIHTDPEDEQDPPDDPDDPENPGELIEEPPEEEPLIPPTVYPALVGLEAVQAALPVLRRSELRVAVYLSAEDIRANGDLVRRLYSAGHTLGLTGDTDAANDALELALCRRSLLCLDQASDELFCHYTTAREADWDTLAGEEPFLLRLETVRAGQILVDLQAKDARLLQLRETTSLFREQPPAEAPEAP